MIKLKNSNHHKKFKSSLHSRASAEKFPGGGGNGKKERKTEKRPKNSTIKSLPEVRGQRKKRPKNSTIKSLPGVRGQRKKDRKIALLSLFLLYLYHV